MTGVDRESLAATVGRLVRLAQVLESEGQIAKRIGEARIESQCLPIACDGFREQTLLHKDDAEIGVADGSRWIDRDGLAY